MPGGSMLTPLCFMVMPFGTKPVVPPVDGAPSRINFDLLWSEAFKPAIEALGYEAHRADQDAGALIVHEMIERLYYSTLVIADMTLPNGNVYYEIGVRQAAQRRGCVLIAADWVRPLFDTEQMRRLTYPLAEESVGTAAAAAIKETLVAGVPALAQGDSPVHTVLPGYPNPNPHLATTMRTRMVAEAGVEAQIEAARLLPPGAARQAAARGLALAYPAAAASSPGLTMAIASALRDADLWEETRDYLQSLPIELGRQTWMQQQLALALSKARSSNHELAIATLEQLSRTAGDSSENRGLIGGRYKRMADAARKANDAVGHRRYLNHAIAAYEAGLRLDLGGYYPASNLARLYRERGDAGDDERAAFALHLTQAACEALRARQAGDEWLRPTLLGVAFDRQDYEAAESLTGEVEIQGPALWQLQATLSDLEVSVAQIQDPVTRTRFSALLTRLQALL